MSKAGPSSVSPDPVHPNEGLNRIVARLFSKLPPFIRYPIFIFVSSISVITTGWTVNGVSQCGSEGIASGCFISYMERGPLQFDAHPPAADQRANQIVSAPISSQPHLLNPAIATKLPPSPQQEAISVAAVPKTAKVAPPLTARPSLDVAAPSQARSYVVTVDTSLRATPEKFGQQVVAVQAGDSVQAAPNGQDHPGWIYVNAQGETGFIAAQDIVGSQ